MAYGYVESSVGYTGTEANVSGALADMVAQVRQRALIATWQQRGTPDGQLPWWEAVMVGDDGETVRVAAGHIDPDAPDADPWGIVDGRLPDDAAPGEV